MKVLANYLFSKTIISKFFCLLGLYILLIVNSYAAGFLELPHQVPYTDTAGITYDYVVQWTFGPSNWRANYCKSSDNLPPALFSQNPTNPASIEIAWFSGSHCHFFFTNGDSTWYDYGVPVSFPFVNGFWDIGLNLAEMVRSNVDIRYYDYETPSVGYDFQGNFGLHQVNPGDLLISASAFGGGEPPPWGEPPEQPVYGDPPPPVTVPPENRKHLVLLIHGWNSDPSAWAIPMKESIKKQLPGYNGQEGCNEGQTIEDANTSWQICTYDWSSSAKLPLTPWEAYVNALNVGKNLAAKIVYEQRSYDFIHFIAHSAGSQVAETAATWLKIFIDTHNVQPGDPLTKPVIHTTFLDAYDPLGSGSNYGASSDWAEQYVDMRRVGDLLLDDTDIMLSGAYNFDITALDPNGNNISGTAAHAWPYEWYEKTIENPANSDYGFSLSLEFGAQQFSSYENWQQVRNTAFSKGRKCVFLSSVSTKCSESGVVAGIAAVRVVIDDVFDVPSAIIDATISPTGSVIFLPSKVIKLITGSPAWASLPIEVAEPIDVLSFDYTYLRQAEGLLSVFFDDQLVFRSDQRVEPAGLNHSDNVPIGAITSGKHTLSFRLDAFNGTQSEIDLSHIQLGKMEVSAPVTNSLTVTKVGSGSGTVTSTPTGIDCGTDCSESYASGTVVHLMATPAAGSTFAGWSGGGCSGTGTCTVTMNQPLGVTATFAKANRPPVANAGPDQTVECAGPNGISVTLDGSGSSDPDGDYPLTFTWTGPFGTAGSPKPTVTLPLGIHNINLEVADGKGGTANDTVTVTVRDTTRPTLSVTLSPNRLWPPNHKMVTVTANVQTNDTCNSQSPTVTLVSIISNEPDNGLGDGDTANDIQDAAFGTDDRTFALRAERSGSGTERIYTATYQAQDRAGNTNTATAQVVVPHDQGKK